MDSPSSIEFGHFRIDVAGRHLLKDGAVVSLTSKAFDTLLVLVRSSDRVVTKDELMHAVWPDTFVSDDSLTQAISSLRRALGDAEYIVTIPRRGYRFIEKPSLQVEPAVGPANHLRQGYGGREAGDARPAKAGRYGRAVMLAAAVVACIAAGALIGRTFLGSATTATTSSLLRFTQEAPGGARIASGGVISPDGASLAFVAEDSESGVPRLWIRTLSAADARPLANTDQAMRPFWSPDGRSIGFVANGRLRTVSLDDGAVRNLAPVRSYASGAAWGRDVIVFANWRAGLESVSPFGGAVTAITTLDTSQNDTAHQWPSFLPDYTHYLFTIVSARRERAGVYVGTLGTSEHRRLLDASHQAAVFVAPHYLVYVRDGELRAQEFDTEQLSLRGMPVTLATNVSPPNLRNTATISAAGALLTYGGGHPPRRLVWFNRRGERLGDIDTPGALHHPAFCADEKEVIAASTEGDTTGVWVVDLERGVPNRLVPDGAVPTPSPDGTMLAFSANRGSGALDVYVRRRSGNPASDVALVRTAEAKYVNDWTRDGRYLVYQSSNAKTGEDLWVVPAAGGTPVSYLRTEFNEIQSRVSPNGRWVAYTSDESGTWQVYVQSFPTPGAKQVVSVRGGGEPVWSRDGRELFYLSADRTLIAVTVTERGDTLQVSGPRALFKPPVAGALNEYRSRYAVTADGQRFIVDAVDADRTQQPISILANWTRLLQQ
jgi:eukaryotic-like serine/threonine-protein kinase